MSKSLYVWLKATVLKRIRKFAFALVLLQNYQGREWLHVYMFCKAIDSSECSSAVFVAQGITVIIFILKSLLLLRILFMVRPLR